MAGIHSASAQQQGTDEFGAYGTRADKLLEDDLGAEIAPQVFEAELTYLRRFEWARTGEDVLWRRSKLGLHLSATERDAVIAWMAATPRA